MNRMKLAENSTGYFNAIHEWLRWTNTTDWVHRGKFTMPTANTRSRKRSSDAVANIKAYTTHCVEGNLHSIFTNSQWHYFAAHRVPHCNSISVISGESFEPVRRNCHIGSISGYMHQVLENEWLQYEKKGKKILESRKESKNQWPYGERSKYHPKIYLITSKFPLNWNHSILNEVIRKYLHFVVNSNVELWFHRINFLLLAVFRGRFRNFHFIFF